MPLHDKQLFSSASGGGFTLRPSAVPLPRAASVDAEVETFPQRSSSLCEEGGDCSL